MRLGRGLHSSIALDSLPRGRFRIVLVLRVRAPVKHSRTLTIARSYLAC